MTDFLDRIDPEVRAVLPSLPELDISDIPSARIRRRELAAQARSRIAPDPSVVTVDLFVDATLRVRHYRPVDQARPLPCLLWLHGGGMFSAR
jgi:acetyl esterase/lipase